MKAKLLGPKFLSYDFPDPENSTSNILVAENLQLIFQGCRKIMTQFSGLQESHDSVILLPEIWDQSGTQK